MITNIFRVAIVGRPNVGKSSLFNRIAGRRIAIVDSVPGITRDRVSANIRIEDKSFELVDTGGYFEKPGTKLEKALLEQQKIALEEADLVLFVMDVLSGIHPMDREILKILRKTSRNIICVINKADNETLENDAKNFLTLGIDNYISVSAQHGTRVRELISMIACNVPLNTENQPSGLKIAVVGKPNAGKSSLVNAILKNKRTIVDENPGTTRDSIYINFAYKGTPCVLIDTAGLTRRHIVKEAVDAYSVMRTRDAISQADVILLVTDSVRGIESQDLRIARLVSDFGKASVIIVNKWDLTKGLRQEHYKKMLYEKMPLMDFAPVIFTSVVSGIDEDKIMYPVLRIKKSLEILVPTARLNQLFEEAVQRNLPPMVGGKRLKIYYATQTSSNPLIFSLFINSKSAARGHYLRYLENKIREQYPFEGLPLKFRLNEKKRNSP